MRWDRSHQSDYVDDRRGQGIGVGPSLGGMGMLLPLAARFGWKGILVAAVVFFIARGAGTCTSSGPGSSAGRTHLSGGAAPAAKGAEDDLAHFVGFVFDDVQSSWAQRFAAAGDRYEPARLVLFTDAVETGCGTAPAEVGPFYCPNDRRVYIDLSFYRDLRERFGAAGDFAQAYVIAHELGHHVELLRRLPTPENGRESVAYELLADCLAGAWGHDAAQRGLLETGDLQEALDAAAAIGDDRIQKQATGSVHPEKFTHGSSAERRAAFERGFGSNGDSDACGVMGR
jgi:predicted metalloprotease